MPLFTVLCSEHGKFEILIKHGEELTCPVCKKVIPRVWEANDTARFILKGKGFYSNEWGTGEHRMH